MGLDIFFNLYKKSRERNEGESLSEYYCALEKKANSDFLKEAKKSIKDTIAELKEAEKKKKLSPVDIYGVYYKMQKYFYYEFERQELKNANSISDIENWAKKINWGCFYKHEDAYFRKVNCIYAYFSERLEDEICEVTKDDILDIIDRATKILANRGDQELAENLLPTQSGFFFGSTEYDEWYYQDMISILEECGKLLKNWEDDDICFVCMNW